MGPLSRKARVKQWKSNGKIAVLMCQVKLRLRCGTIIVRRHLQPHTGVHENNYFVVCIVIFLSFAFVVFFCPVICPCHFSVIFLSFFCCFLFWSCPLSLSFFCHVFVIFLSFSYHFLQFLMIFFNRSNFF